jgi:hypothetical protein
MTEIEKRQPVWLALSEFYLDTELTIKDLDRVSEKIIDSGYSLQEIKEIDLYEVFPLLKSNLLTVAGNWAGFDQQWIYENCELFYKKRNSALFRFKIKVFNIFNSTMRKNYWQQIEKKIKNIQAP